MSDIARQRGGWRSGGIRLAMWGVLAAVLALPAVAMRMHAEGVVWSGADFAVMGVMLASVGIGVELVVRASPSPAWRSGAVVAVVTAFLTVWVNLAAGMIGSELNPYNLFFGGVLLLALAGAFLARFRASGMAKAMAATGIAQAAAGAVGFPADARGALFSMLFAGPWLLSAALFALAARDRAGA